MKRRTFLLTVAGAAAATALLPAADLAPAEAPRPLLPMGVVWVRNAAGDPLAKGRFAMAWDEVACRWHVPGGVRVDIGETFQASDLLIALPGALPLVDGQPWAEVPFRRSLFAGDTVCLELTLGAA